MESGRDDLNRKWFAMTNRWRDGGHVAVAFDKGQADDLDSRDLVLTDGRPLDTGEDQTLRLVVQRRSQQCEVVNKGVVTRGRPVFVLQEEASTLAQLDHWAPRALAAGAEVVGRIDLDVLELIYMPHLVVGRRTHVLNCNAK